MSAKPLLILALLALAGCYEQEMKQTKENRAMQVAAWNACIDSGGVPIEGWLGAPQMIRCEYQVKPGSDSCSQRFFSHRRRLTSWLDGGRVYVRYQRLTNIGAGIPDMPEQITVNATYNGATYPLTLNSGQTLGVGR